MRTRGGYFAAALLAALFTTAAPAAAQSLEYAVKVVCGRTDAPFTVPGTYATVVNVHNPSRELTVFQFKVAAAGPLREVGISAFQTLRLRPDGALAITCREISRAAGQQVVDGFVVIQTRIDLDVVAVYSAAGNGGVSTMDVERVAPRRMAQ